MQIFGLFISVFLIAVSAKIAFADLLDKPEVKKHDEK